MQFHLHPLNVYAQASSKKLIIHLQEQMIWAEFSEEWAVCDCSPSRGSQPDGVCVVLLQNWSVAIVKPCKMLRS